MELTDHPLDLAEVGIGHSSGVRAAGLHASDIYNDLFQDLEPNRYKRDREAPLLVLELGLIFEQMLEEGLARRLATSVNGEEITRPGELTHEGEFEGHPFTLHYSPDLFIFPKRGELRLGEIKATKMSPKEAPLAPKFEKYWVQIKLYCWLQRTPFARLYVLFINGHYRPTMDPIFQAWDVTFSQDELDTNYAMCLYHALHKGML